MSKTVMFKEISKNATNNVNKLLIMKDQVTNNILIYNGIATNQLLLSKRKQTINNEYIFVKCLLYLRNYFAQIEYKCSVGQMQHVTSLVAKKIWRIIDEDNFDEQMDLIATDLAIVLAG